MISLLYLQNFQSHKETKVEFSPGVNVIVGLSRRGKTSLLRAIKWVAENRPAGDEFRSHWAKKGITAVSMKLTPGGVVERHKGNAVNKYVLNGEEFSGFGQDVPKPVAEALNLDSLNIQDQFAAPFLLFDSPGAAARYLNQVVHLDVIDIALANVNSLKRQNDQDTRACEARMAELEGIRESFPDLAAAEEYIASLELQYSSMAEKMARGSALATLQDKIIVGKILLDKAKVPDGILERVTGLADKAGRKAQLGYTRQMLSKIQVSLTEGLASMGRLEPSLGMGEAIIRLENGVRALQSHRKNLQRLRAIQGKIGDIAIELKGRLGKIAGMESWLADNTPEVCPLCGK